MSEQPPIEPTIQIDPTFAYYRDRSVESIASELALAGYRAVRYFVTDETNVNGRLVEALKNRGMRVWAMVLGNGAYSTGHLPPDWREWQMVLLKPVNDGFYRLSPFSSRYLQWKKAVCAELVRRYPFDGFEVAEPYFPEWNGLDSWVYGDVGPLARAAFKQFSGGEMPEFRYRSSPYYYKKDVARYLLWIEFRVQAVNAFLNAFINGPGGVREARPDIRVATWSVAVDAGRDPVRAVREYQGVDAAEMIRTVRPDVHVLQTHWPDWMRVRLPADYVKRYEPFVQQIRASHASIPLGVQTDIGSLRRMRRSTEWVRTFAATADQLGYRFWTAYEYSIGLWMYKEKPIPLQAERVDRSRIRIAFNKRVDEVSAAARAHYRLHQRGDELCVPFSILKVDGSWVILQSDHWPADAFEIEVSGVQDTPSRWLVQGEPANETPRGSHVPVAPARP
ncbi:N-acyl-D-glucosamine 2-epimerase [Paenibacillus cremeus]|uniref:N-acyl-D-glucosamine 2-epimerase n=1 Tax=Paenibacillus cremeus TaxID=2163881 RepID=A0A559KD25_9BACL|nr:N-acyl-D-glucosamine 2-epimerase [Paenibacillus cremeus]TVY10040.1 N-acyl-D-glucosamine 2-epimerase [Paenibacillus cremeus]